MKPGLYYGYKKVVSTGNSRAITLPKEFARRKDEVFVMVVDKRDQYWVTEMLKVVQ